jgi:glycosyltransferase involved in cell wall biosynthesis
MNLLIITQKVDRNDSILGFFHAWIKSFSQYFQKITVICLEKGDYDLPENVRVLSLGKERHAFNSNIFHRFLYAIKLIKISITERKSYDAVFIHMIPEYVILGGIFWKIFRKDIYLWYAHKTVSLRLKIAEKFVTNFFTASEKSFRLPSKKVMITGQGIDVDYFKPQNKSGGNNIKILSIGRISPIKNIHILIDVAKLLKNDGLNTFAIELIGNPIAALDWDYLESLKDKIKENKLENNFIFIGKIPNNKVVEYLNDGNIFVNLSGTGSLDKAVLEAMACGLQVLTSNEAFRNILPPENITSNNANEVFKKIKNLSKKTADSMLRETIVKHHNLDNLSLKIYNIITSHE